MNWPRIRFTLAMLTAVLIGTGLAAGELILSYRLERWQTGKR